MHHRGAGEVGKGKRKESTVGDRGQSSHEPAQCRSLQPLALPCWHVRPARAPCHRHTEEKKKRDQDAGSARETPSQLPKSFSTLCPRPRSIARQESMGAARLLVAQAPRGLARGGPRQSSAANTCGTRRLRGVEEGENARHSLHRAAHAAHGVQLRERDLQQRAFVLLQSESYMLPRVVVYPKRLRRQPKN